MPRPSMSRLKIVDVCELYADRGGGIKTYVNQKLEAGARLGHDVVVVAPGPTEGEEVRGGGRVVWVKSRPMPFDPRYYLLTRERAVHAVLDRERPDVLEGSSPWQGGWFASRWRGEAVRSFIFHSDPVAIYGQTFLDRFVGADRVDQLAAPYWRWLRGLAGRYDVTVCASAWLAGRLRAKGIANAEPVPFGVDTGWFDPSRRDPALKAELLAQCGLPADATLAVTVSRFHPEKRLATVFEGLRGAQAWSPKPIGLVLYGTGPTEASVRARAAATPHVHVVGFEPDRERLAGAMASADFMLHGSASETFGLVLAEGLASGLPLVVPSRGGAADFGDTRWAEVYPPGDAAACTSAIQRLIARDLGALGAAARTAGRATVPTMDDHFAQLFERYGELVG